MWTNSKFGKRQFIGSYERDSRDERIFVLNCEKNKRRIVFESFQAAKKLGWKRKEAR